MLYIYYISETPICQQLVNISYTCPIWAFSFVIFCINPKEYDHQAACDLIIIYSQMSQREPSPLDLNIREKLHDGDLFPNGFSVTFQANVMSELSSFNEFSVGYRKRVSAKIRDPLIRIDRPTRRFYRKQALNKRIKSR